MQSNRELSRGQAWLLALVGVIGAVSISVVLPSLPAIAQDLSAGAGDEALILTLYLAGLAVGQLVWGPASDRWGRRGGMLAGLLLFVVSSLACAVASDIASLVACRFAQALGACAGPVLSRAVARDVCEGERLGRLIALLSAVYGASPLLGPALGGVLQVWLGWRVVFGLLAACGLGLAIAVWFALPETLARDRPRLTSAAAFGSFVSDGVFMAALLGGGFLAGVVYVYQAGAPRLFIVDWGLSPDVYGCFGFVTGAGYVAVTTFLARRKTPFRPAKLAAVGGAWAAAGAAAFLIEIAAGVQSLWVILPTMAAVSVGLGFGVPGTTAAALQRHGRAAGAASALLGCGTIGMGSLGTLLLSEAGHGQPMAMTVVMAASGVAAALACWVLWRWDTAASRVTALPRVVQPST